MNEIPISLETLATLGTLPGHPLAGDASPEMLCANIGSRYDFQPQPVEIRLADAIVTIQWADDNAGEFTFVNGLQNWIKSDPLRQRHSKQSVGSGASRAHQGTSKTLPRSGR
jgi:hypothetical protein